MVSCVFTFTKKKPILMIFFDRSACNARVVFQVVYNVQFMD